MDNDAFPFMTWRDGAVAGLPARVCRISFSGELAFEVNVSGWDGLALWEALLAAGADLDITPYGTETMHVLRAEKGYPIIGQDTDGTVTPQDLGMAWVVSKKKAGLHRQAVVRPRGEPAPGPQAPGRRCCRSSGTVLLPEGAQLVGSPQLPAPPVPMLGPRDLQLPQRGARRGRSPWRWCKGGRERIGETLYSPVGGTAGGRDRRRTRAVRPRRSRRDG